MKDRDPKHLMNQLVLLTYYEGVTDEELFEEYDRQREEGVLSGSCSSTRFPDNMDFISWLKFQVDESEASKRFDI